MGRKAVPRSLLLAVGSKKRNVLRTHAPSKKKLCLEKLTPATGRGSKSSSKLPLNEADLSTTQVAGSSSTNRASTSRNPVDFQAPPPFLP